VEDRHVKRVHQVFVVLQPVARNDGGAAAAHAAVVGFEELARVECLQHVVTRQHRLTVRRTHVREDQPVALLHRIPRLPHALALAAAIGLARLLETVALHVEEPAVIAAADAARLHPAVVQAGAAMRAAGDDEPGASFTVTEQHEVFAEDADGLRRCRGIGDEADGMPVAPHQFAHGRARAHVRELMQ
jgi:hypothetical protein